MLRCLGYGWLVWLFVVLSVFGSVSSELPFNEDFESDGAGLRYVQSVQFFDLLEGIFSQTTDLTHGFDGSYTNQVGLGIFASEDTDDMNNGGDGMDEQRLVFTVDVLGETNLVFDALFAAGALSTFDLDDHIFVEAQIDAGPVQRILQFESISATVGSQPMAEDTTGDGVGDGAVLGFAFRRYSAPIAGSGFVLTLRILIEADSGFESLAMDDVNVTASVAEERMGEVLISSNGAANVSFSGAAGRTYRVESSESLTPAVWVDRGVMKTDVLGGFIFVDPPMLPLRRYYRVVYP